MLHTNNRKRGAEPRGKSSRDHHKAWFAEDGSLLKPIPKCAVMECTQAHDNSHSLTYWRNWLGFEGNAQQAYQYLQAITPMTDLLQITTKTMFERILGIACDAIRHTGEWEGMVI